MGLSVNVLEFVDSNGVEMRGISLECTIISKWLSVRSNSENRGLTNITYTCCKLEVFQ